MSAPYSIHFTGAPYSNALYDERGREIWTEEAALEAAEALYGPEGWEVYN